MLFSCQRSPITSGWRGQYGVRSLPHISSHNHMVLNPRPFDLESVILSVPSCILISPTRRWFYQWKWQCSKSWSHSQNSLCSQISIRRGCACGMLDRGCLLWFTTVYYYVNGKTRRIHSRGRLLLSVDHAHMAWFMDFIRDARAGHAINTCTHAKQKTMYTAVIGKILNFSWEKCVTSR